MSYNSRRAYIDYFELQRRELFCLQRMVGRAYAVAARQRFSDDARSCFLDLLDQLRDRVAQHLAEESSGGCLDEAVAAAPRYRRQAWAILRRWPRLFGRVSRLRDYADYQSRFATRWSRLGSRTNRLLQTLEAQEAAEEDVLIRSLNMDPKSAG